MRRWPQRQICSVAVDEYARVMIEDEASKSYEASPWRADKRAAEIVRPAPVQSADNVPPKSLAWLGTWRLQSYNRGFWQQRRRYSRLRSYTAKCLQNTSHHAYCGRTWHWHVLDGRVQITDRTCAMEDGHGVTARCYAR